MSKIAKKSPDEKTTFQFRLPIDDERGAKLAQKIEKIAAATGLSMNDVANMAVAAGLTMVETKLKEIHEPAQAKAA